MLVAEKCLFNFLKKYVDRVAGLKGVRPIPADADLLAFASLTLIVEYGASFTQKNELIKLLNECQALIKEVDKSKYIPVDFILADAFPFLLSKALLEKDDLILKEGAAPYWLLSHHNSEVRKHCFNVIWFFRQHADRGIVLDNLLKNIADTLGYVEHAIGPARSFFESDDEFFRTCSFFEPEGYEGQFRNRITEVKNRNLLVNYKGLYLPLELEVRKLIENEGLYMNVSDRNSNQLTLL